MRDGERYYSFSSYCKDTFGRRLYRCALDAGFTCPVRDGSKDSRGCIFCAGGSGDFAISYHGQDLDLGDMTFNHQNVEEGDYIAYFQAYTNTYGTVEHCRKLFSAALSSDLFAGISIATRPDCLDEDMVKMLEELKEEYPSKFIWVELGLQTMHERTALWMRRGYDLSVYDACMERLNEAGIPVIVHVIIGLPDETEEDLKATILHLNETGVSGVKLQLLQYLKGTDLGEDYMKNSSDYHPLTEEEYVDLACMCLGYLKKDIVIHRLTGDADRNLLLAPEWAVHKKHTLNLIRKRMKELNLEQGGYL